ncbi:MAG: hypothetical protein JWQ88_2798 [Rhodoferax sp.]|nr:hypothetical protein [Rhodoferax sp.]
MADIDLGDSVNTKDTVFGTPQDAPGAELRLRLTHNMGRPRDGACIFPTGGAGLAAALELDGVRLSHAQWHAANLCRIEWRHGGWQWQNRNPKLVCALNGQRLALDFAAPLAVGDVIEVGLMRFVTESVLAPTVAFLSDAALSPGLAFVKSALEDAAGSAAAADQHTACDTGENGAARSPSRRGIGEFDGEAFDLRDLANPLPDTVNAESWAANRSDSPFGVLDISGAEHAPERDVLAGMLAEPSARRGMARFNETDLLEAAAAAGAAPWPAPTMANQEHDDALQGTASQAEASVPPPSADARVLQALHQEFVRVVRDPSQLTGRTDWDSALDAGSQPAPTMEELSQQAGRFALLRDIVLPTAGIDDVIGDFDPLRQSTLLAELPAQDVLHLFAPELARSARQSLPGLTQREHHALSPDSHMRLGRFEPADELPP